MASIIKQKNVKFWSIPGTVSIKRFAKACNLTNTSLIAVKRKFFLIKPGTEAYMVLNLDQLISDTQLVINMSIPGQQIYFKITVFEHF